MTKAKFFLCFHFLALNMIALGIAQEISTDYTPATKALNYLNNIRSNYNMFKVRVEKNLTLEYTKCIDSINTLKCQNIDQWQSVIEELKLEINNSESTEVPFLTERKEKKVSELELLLNRSSIDNDNFTQLSETLRIHQQGIINKMYYIQNMYKLPKMAAFIQEGPAENTETPEAEAKPEAEAEAKPEAETEAKPETEEKTETDVATDLNADVPDIAKKELGKAKSDYELADLSIQAQTTVNMLRNYGQKCSETLEHLEQSYQGRLEDIMQKKLKLKEDILKVRQMLINENKIKEKNSQKISEMENKIEKCQGKPTNIEKDCEPLRVNGNKILTEIDIVNARTLLLHKEVSKLLLENYSSEELKQLFAQQVPKPQPVDENQYYLNEPNSEKKKQNVQYEPKEPQELYPIYHYKDQIKDKKEGAKEEQTEEGAEDQPAEEGAEDQPAEGGAEDQPAEEQQADAEAPNEEAQPTETAEGQ